MSQETRHQLSALLKFILCMHCCVAFAYVAYPQITNPSEINGLAAWWCADSVQQDDGSLVSFWNNMANTTESVSQPISENSPTLVKNVSELNNHSVLRFDGNDYLDGGDIMNVGKVGQTAFVVAKSMKDNGCFFAKSITGIANCRNFLTYEDGALFYFNEPVKGNYYQIKGKNNKSYYDILSTTCNLSIAKIFFYQSSGVLKSENLLVVTNTFKSSYNFIIGSYNNSSGTIPPLAALNLNGDIAEMIFYNRPLSNIERQTVENYLRSKYFPGTEREQFSLGGDVERAYGFKPIVLSVPEREYFQTYAWNTGAITPSINVTESGLYSVHVTDDWGYEYYDTVAIVLPSISYIPSQTICDGESVVWDCGLAGDYTYLWSTGEDTQAITITKAGKYAVKVTDNQGYSILSDTVEISVDDFSTAARLGADTTVCDGNEIGLIARAEDVVQYEWNTGDKTELLVVHESGTYSVTVTNERGCVATDEIEITVKGVAPVAQFVYQNSCFSDTTEFISNSYTTDNTSIESTEWFVESDTLDGIAANHRFSSAGIFPVRLKVVNEAGCVTEKTEGIVIHEKPVAQFSPKIACQYTACDISSTSQAGDDAIVSYEWQGLQRKENNKKFEFVSDSVAAYPIMLTVVSEYGCVDTLKDSVVVVESSKVEFVHTRTCIGDTVLIIDETVCQPYNYMLSGQWEYDGVTLPYKKILMVRLEDTIPHSVGLFVKTFNGCLNIMRDTIQAHVLPQPKLPEVLYGCIGKDIVLRDFGDSDDSISMRQWSIGDEILTEEAPTVHFAESGTYDYSLALTTEYECSSSTAGQIVVEKTPMADFTFFPEYGAAPLDVQFTNTSVGAATSLWTFESSVEVAEENPEYTFTEEALSYVQLRVASEHGCADSIQKYVSVQLSNMKLQITDVLVSEQNGKVHYTIQVLNSGNDVIPEIEFSLSSPDFPTLTELWTGKLLPNTVLTYEFTTKTALKNKELPAYVCVDASIASSVQNKIGYTDTYCKDFSDEFNVYSVSPNPVTDVAVLAFSTKQNETIVVECVDESGKIRMSQALPAMPSGFHTCRIDMSQLPSGIYAIRVLQGNKKETIQVIKI